MSVPAVTRDAALISGRDGWTPLVGGGEGGEGGGEGGLTTDLVSVAARGGGHGAGVAGRNGIRSSSETERGYVAVKHASWPRTRYVCECIYMRVCLAMQSLS